MYTLNITKTIKKCQSMKSETFFLKTIIKEVDFLRKTVIFIETLQKKRLLLLENK